LFSSCKEIDLDLSPEDYFASGSFWQNNEQVAGAMLGLHSQLRGQQQNLWNLSELRGGTLRNGTSFTGTASLNSAGVITQDIRESSPGISAWAGLYAPIFQINNFIYQVEKADYLNEAQKGYYLGQAYGLRAFYYFYLFRTYGRVPLVTEPQAAVNTPASAEEAYKARTETEKETFDFIKSEIDKSEQAFAGNFETKNQKAQWSLAATKMLKTEVYLWSAKVDLDGKAPANVNADLLVAKAAVEEVIPKYSLVSNFGDQFKSASTPAMKGNSEMIFVMRYLYGEATSFFNNFIYAAGDDITGYVDDKGQAIAKDPLQAGSTGIIRYEYKIDLYRLYDKADTRANATFLNFNKGTTSAVVFRKFLGTLIDGVRNYSDDYPVYRLAEAYLFLAEIKNKLGQDPTAEIMAVRKRAYGGSAPAFTNGSFEANELAIFYERTKEFVSEGKRWFDLIRMQDASGKPLVFRKDLNLVGVLDNVDGQKHKILWPIDLGTLTADPKLIGNQNPGYSGT
jgi:hypothetical protein